MNWGIFIGLSVSCLSLSWAWARIGVTLSGRGILADVPGPRSSHDRVTIRGGGAGLALGACGVVMALGFRSWGGSGEGGSLFLVGLGGLIVAGSGFWDDASRLAPGWKYLFQLLGCGLVLLGAMCLLKVHWPWGGEWALGWLAVPLTLFWITGMTNLYNFMDGIDGIAGGVGVLYGLGVAWAAFLTGHPAEGAAALALVAGCLGFLWYNFPPAKIFMGDVGSLLLGFLFAVLAVRLSQAPSHPVPFCFFVILYSSFIFDAAYTLVRRLLKGEKVWQPHRSHLYQRLVIAGWSHLQVTLLYMALSAVSLALAMLSLGTVGPLRCLWAVIQLSVCFGLVVLVKVIEGRFAPSFLKSIPFAMTGLGAGQFERVGLKAPVYGNPSGIEELFRTSPPRSGRGILAETEILRTSLGAKVKVPALTQSHSSLKNLP